MALKLLALAFIAACLALAGTDLLSWRRTTSLRPRGRRVVGRGARWTATEPQGRPPLEAWPSGTSTSSPATFLAALAGVFAVAWGSAAVATRHPGGVAAVPWGAFVAGSGLRARVTALDVRGAGLLVRYAAKPAFFVSWASLRAMRPPRTPVGAWRIDSVSGSVSLMPSDLIGRERVLEAVVWLGGLSFDGRAWRRGRAPPATTAGVR